MDAFGGGFDLPDLSLGKPKKEIRQGLNDASNILKNTGEEAENLFFGHSNKQNANNGLSLGAPGFGGISLGNGGQQGLGLNLDASFNKIGGDLNKAGNALEKNGKETINYIFGKEKNGLHNTNSLSLPSVPAIGEKINNFGNIGSLNRIENDLNKAGNVLEKKGEETIDYFFGKEKNGYHTESARIPNLSPPNLSFGGGKPPGLSIGSGKSPGLTIGGGKPPGLSIGGGKLPGLSVGGGKLRGLSIGGSKPPDLSIGGSKPPDLSIGGGKLPGLAVGGGKPPGLSIGGVKPPGLSIGGGKPPGLSIGGGKPPDLSIGDGKLPGLSVGGGKLPGLSVGGGKLPGLSVGGGKLPSSSNGGGKLPGLSIGGGKLPGLSIGGGKPPGLSIGAVKPPGLSIGGVKPPGLSIGGVKPPGLSIGGVKPPGVSIGVGKPPVLSIGGGKPQEDVGKIGSKLEKAGGQVTNKIFGGKNPTSPGLSTSETNEKKSTQSMGGTKMDKGGGNISTSSSGRTTNSFSRTTSSSGRTTYSSGRTTSSSGGTTSSSGKNTSSSGGITSSSGKITSSSGRTSSFSGATANFSGMNTSPSGMTTSSYKTTPTSFKTITSISGTTTPPEAQSITKKMQEGLGKTSPGHPLSTSNQNGITEKQSTFSAETNTYSTGNSLENSTDDVTELPDKTSIKSEEALKKIEAILQGSGKETTTQAPVVTEKITKFTDQPTSTSTKSEPALLQPYYPVPNTNSTIGEDFTPVLPPTVFDKPTGEKAPFIPVLPSSMVTTTGTSVGPPNRGLNTPAPQAPPSESLTPLEYSAIGVGVVLILTFIGYFYQQYRKRVNKRSSGSYSPNASHKGASDRRRSNNSEGGQSQEVKEADKHTTSPGGANRIDPEVVVVEMTPEVRPVEEVVEAPITKTVVNDLQKSAPTEDRQTVLTQQTPDSFEVISEVKSPMEKPPRKTKTAPNTPEKFTSDKTSASNLNQDSLKTVGHAIGGILKNQEPHKNNTKKQPNEESSGESGEEGVSLLGKLVAKNLPENTSSSHDTTNEMPVQAGNSENEPLYRSIENEVDAGSEYYSADENPESKTSPPMSPLPEKKFGNIDIKNLRAEDVYNTEIVLEDGRRRSIEEDIAESIKKNDDPMHEDTVQKSSASHIEKDVSCVNESLSTSQSSPEVLPSDRQIPNKSGDVLKERTIPEEIHIKNMINSEKNASEQFEKEEAEAIVDHIIRTSCLDQVTMKTIQQDLGNPETSTRSTSSVKFSDNAQLEANVDGNKSSNNIESCNFLKNIIHTAEPEPSQPKNVRNSNAELIQPNNAYIQEPASVKVDAQGSLLGTPYGNILGKETHVENIEVTKDEDDTPPTTTNSDNNVQPESTNNINNQSDSLGHSNDSVDEGCVVDQRFECIPPKQPQIFEDDMIIFSNSSSPTPIANSEVNSSAEVRSTPTTSTDQVGQHDGLMSLPEFIAGTSGVSKTIKENNEKSPQHNSTKWYVPDDTSEPGVIEVENKNVEGLYIVLSDEKPNIEPREPAATIIPSNDSTRNELLNQPKTEKRVNSNISYAYLEVNDDPINEGWPEHLPKNIHSVSGVSLVKTADASSSLYSVLKEEGEINPSTSTSVSEAGDSKGETTNTLERIPAKGHSGTMHKPIPEFIIPNMDRRLSKKRMSKRRQIKSLDSGVHHYYGEYLSLAELPEHESENVEKKENGINGENNDSGVIEEVLTIKPDGTITEEKIVIQNNQN